VKDLLVVTPSRSRPQNIERLWGAMQDTCKAETDLYVGLDDDDPYVTAYPAGPDYRILGGMQHNVVGWMNMLAAERGHNYRAIGHFGDDCVPRTPGWDTQILEALEKTQFAFGNDLSTDRPEGTLCTHVFMRRPTMERLGYFGPPVMRHMWVDLVWMTWGYAAGITYLPDVVIEHMHFMEGKAKKDASYAASRELIARDWEALLAYVQVPMGLNADIRKISVFARQLSSLQDFFRVHREHGLKI
jgi:hypothetical protein